MGLKIQILRNRKYLEETTIYIKEDFTQKILKKRRELQEEFRARKEQGENIAMKYDKIITLKSNPEKITALPINEQDHTTQAVEIKKENQAHHLQVLLKPSKETYFIVPKKIKPQSNAT